MACLNTSNCKSWWNLLSYLTKKKQALSENFGRIWNTLPLFSEKTSKNGLWMLKSTNLVYFCPQSFFMFSLLVDKISAESDFSCLKYPSFKLVTPPKNHRHFS